MERTGIFGDGAFGVASVKLSSYEYPVDNMDLF